jgi:monofunctional biosynthetic peptidoglycan transglycosylase
MARVRARRRARIASAFVWLLRGLFGFVLLSVLWVLLYRFVNPPITFTQLGDRLEGRNITRQPMGLDRISRNMVRAAIAAEDGKFCSHRGFDTDAIVAAMKRNARGGSVIRGGSTISQQTAKNAFLWQGGGYFRKGLEAWFTLLIENLWGKRRIMEVYLNVAETGIGTYGVNAGSLRYFGHDASTLSAVEAARLAAVLPLPKERGAIAPQGFTRRYGNMIAARVGVVGRDGLDACVYKGAAAPAAQPAPVRRKAAPPPEPIEEPGEEYEAPQPAPAPEQPAPEPKPAAQPPSPPPAPPPPETNRQ